MSIFSLGGKLSSDYPRLRIVIRFTEDASQKQINDEEPSAIALCAVKQFVDNPHIKLSANVSKWWSNQAGNKRDVELWIEIPNDVSTENSTTYHDVLNCIWVELINQGAIIVNNPIDCFWPIPVRTKTDNLSSPFVIHNFKWSEKLNGVSVAALNAHPLFAITFDDDKLSDSQKKSLEQITIAGKAVQAKYYDELALAYQSPQLVMLLKDFFNRIDVMDKSTDKQDKIEMSRLNSFKALYYQLLSNLNVEFADKNKAKLYVAIFSHFIKIADLVNKKHVFTIDELKTLEAQLDKQINHKFLSPCLKAAICGVIGALVGAIVGFVVGAAFSFWGGCFAALPGAIVGGLIGMTIAQGLVLGGVAAGTGLISGCGATLYGYYSGQRNAKQNRGMKFDYSQIKSDVEAVNQHLSLTASCKS